MIYVKVAAYILSSFLAVLVLYMVHLGITLRRAREAHETDLWGEAIHQLGAKACLWITLAAALLIESTLFARYGFHARPHIEGFLIHMWFGVVPFMTCLGVILIFGITGFRSRFWHRILAYTCVVTMVPMVFVGDIMIYHL